MTLVTLARYYFETSMESDTKLDLPDVLYRMVWNRKAWTQPTGDEKYSDAYTGICGFGHEEWNFAYDDAMDDYLYGYVYYNPAELPKQGLSTYSLGFWAIEEKGGDWYFIGEYRKAEKVAEDEHLRLHDYFRNKRIYDRRVEQLLPITADRTEYKDIHKREWDFTKLGYKKRVKILRDDLETIVLKGEIKVKCPIEEAILYTRPRPISDNLKKAMLSRRAQQYGVVCYSARLDPRGTTKSALTKDPKSTRMPLEDGSYWRESSGSRREVLRLHRTLSNQFALWLEAKGYRGVVQETKRVDVEFWSGRILCRAELKVCRGGKPLWSIREAIGQLMQYNHYGERKRAKRWYIIIDQVPNDKDKKLIMSIRRKYGIPIALGWRLPRTEDFHLEQIS